MASGGIYVVATFTELIFPAGSAELMVNVLRPEDRLVMMHDQLPVVKVTAPMAAPDVVEILMPAPVSAVPASVKEAVLVEAGTGLTVSMGCAVSTIMVVSAKPSLPALLVASTRIR